MMGQIRVVIADDHPVVLTGLQGMLAGQPDLEVVGEASTGAEAVALTAQLRPDVVLMDLRMPEVDGVTAIAQIKAQQSDVHILVLTTYDTDADILRAVEAGATGYLLKDAPRDAHVRKPDEEPLSAREIEVLSLVARGASNRGIARELHVSEATVKTHLIHIYEKLGVADRTAAVTTALRRGILQLEP